MSNIGLVPLDTVLGDYKQSVAAVYLKDFLQTTTADWRMPTKFSRDGFRRWMTDHTHAAGAYGLELILEGFDGLVGADRVAQCDDGFEMTPEFIGIMEPYGRAR